MLFLTFSNLSSQLPDFIIFDRAGEVTVTVDRCPDSLVLSHEQMSLVTRFHGYVFKHILNLGSLLNFDLGSVSNGYLAVLLKNAEQASPARVAYEKPSRMVAFEFIRELEESLGSFQDPKDPPPVGLQDFEVFRHRVIVSTYSEKRLRYCVADICYDRSPMDPFPTPEIAASFKEYYESRYNVRISPEQPLLDVDRTSVRLDFLVPRYQSTKGKELELPGKDSKRSQRAKIHLIPELCSIHPIPAYLWRWIVSLPSILYRIESLLLAEELRSTLAREIGAGAVEWPSAVPLPLLTVGEHVGESVPPGKSVQCSKMTNELGSDLLGESCKKASMSSNVGKDADGIVEAAVTKFHDDGPEALDAAIQDVHLPVKCDSGISLSFDAPQSSAILTEGDAIRQAESVPKQAVSCSVDASALHGPPSTLLLRALTCNSAGDMFSLERLEMYGDSFIKHAVSSELFNKYPYENEGKLSFTRGLRVSNRQLFYLGRRKSIPAYMFTHVFDPISSWIPPGFCVDVEGDRGYSQMNLAPSQEQDEDEEETCFGDEPGEVTGRPISSTVLNSYLHHCVSDKAVADATEALLGAYLLYCGPEGALRFLSWLGMDVSCCDRTAGAPCSEAKCKETSPAAAGCKVAFGRDSGLSEITSKVCAFQIDDMVVDKCPFDGERQGASAPSHTRQAIGLTDLPPDAGIVKEALKDEAQSVAQEFHEIEASLKDEAQSVAQEFHEIEASLKDEGQSVAQEFHEIEASLKEEAQSVAQEFHEIEASLKYVFSDKSLLLQAFTHASFPREYNTVRSSYEQLEFLGDALMDFLLTRHLYHCQPNKDPGAMTDLRSALVNNYIFAALSVRCGFHRHLRSMSPALFEIVNAFVVKLEETEREREHANPDQVKSSCCFVGVVIYCFHST